MSTYSLHEMTKFAKFALLIPNCTRQRIITCTNFVTSCQREFSKDYMNAGTPDFGLIYRRKFETF